MNNPSDQSGKRRRRQTSENLSQAFNMVLGSITADAEVGGAVRLEAVTGMLTLPLLIALGLMF